MTIETTVLSEMYTVMKQYIPQRDRQEAADNVMSIMVDLLSDEQLKEFGATDRALEKSFQEYVSDVDAAEYDDDGYQEYED